MYRSPFGCHRPQFVGEPFFLQYISNGCLKAWRFVRLTKEIDGPQMHAFYGYLSVVLCGNNNDVRRRIVSPEFPQEVYSGYVGQTKIQ